MLPDKAICAITSTYREAVDSLWIADHEAADRWGGWICDGMQKYIIFVNDIPEKPNIMQNCILFAGIFEFGANGMQTCIWFESIPD